jgi:hypothetical protein
LGTAIWACCAHRSADEDVLVLIRLPRSRPRGEREERGRWEEAANAMTGRNTRAGQRETDRTGCAGVRIAGHALCLEFGVSIGCWFLNRSSIFATAHTSKSLPWPIKAQHRAKARHATHVLNRPFTSADQQTQRVLMIRRSLWRLGASLLLVLLGTSILTRCMTPSGIQHADAGEHPPCSKTATYSTR